MTPDELLAVLDAIPGVQVAGNWPCDSGEIERSKVFVTLVCDMRPSPDQFVIRIERGGEGDGHSDRRDLPEAERG